MAEIRNTEVTNEAIDGLKINPAFEEIPHLVGNQVIPCFETNPKLVKNVNFITGIGSSTSGNTSIYTTPLNQDLYISGLYLSIAKDATCDIAIGTISINASINNVATQICSIAVLPTTAQYDTVVINLTKMIKVDRGSTLSLIGTFTAGSLYRYCKIFGYLSPNSNA